MPRLSKFFTRQCANSERSVFTSLSRYFLTKFVNKQKVVGNHRIEAEEKQTFTFFSFVKFLFIVE